jgi:hypothetical protein
MSEHGAAFVITPMFFQGTMKVAAEADVASKIKIILIRPDASGFGHG